MKAKNSEDRERKKEPKKNCETHKQRMEDNTN